MASWLARIGESLLIGASVGIAVLRSGTSDSAYRLSPGPLARLDQLNSRLDIMAESVADLQSRTTAVEQAQAQSLTRSDLDLALEQAFAPLYSDLDRRFEQQAESVQALRVMVSRTDELLDRVLENLESMEHQIAA